MHIELGGMFLTSFSIIEVIEKLQHVSFLVYVTPIELMCWVLYFSDSNTLYKKIYVGNA